MDTLDTAEGSGEDPAKCSNEERNEDELKAAEALKENFEKKGSITTTHIYGADEKGTDSEDESGARVEVRKRPNIIIDIQFDRLGKTWSQFHTSKVQVPLQQQAGEAGGERQQGQPG